MFKTKNLLGAFVIGCIVAATIHSLMPPHLTMTNTYTVQAGDTMWDIATKYNGGDAKTDEVIYEIKKQNHLDSADLQPGMELKVPSPSAR